MKIALALLAAVALGAVLSLTCPSSGRAAAAARGDHRPALVATAGDARPTSDMLGWLR